MKVRARAEMNGIENLHGTDDRAAREMAQRLHDLTRDVGLQIVGARA